MLNGECVIVAYLDYEPTPTLTYFPQRRDPQNAAQSPYAAQPPASGGVVGLVQVGGEGGDAALPDFRVLLLVLADAVEVLDVAGAAQQLHKVLVVGDDQQLEVALPGATLDDPAHTHAESFFVFLEHDRQPAFRLFVTQRQSRKILRRLEVNGFPTIDI